MKINTYHINCNTSVTDLCEIGAKYGHDKFFDSISFIEFNHENSELGEFNNDKIILMVSK